MINNFELAYFGTNVRNLIFKHFWLMGLLILRNYLYSISGISIPMRFKTCEIGIKKYLHKVSNTVITVLSAVCYLLRAWIVARVKLA